jgi:zinc protease
VSDAESTAKSAKKTAPHTGAPVRFDLEGGGVGFVESSQAVPLVSIVVALRTGAAFDPQGKDGVVRFTARMLRRGCKGLTSPEIEEAIDRLGAELGVDVGPTTTSLHGQVIRRNLEPFVELLCRILGMPTFADDELARLRRETIAEVIEARDNDRALAGVAFRRAVFEGHPYSRSAAGRPSTLEHITKDDVLDAYETRFVRGALVVGFAGAITTGEAKALGARIAASLPDRPRRATEIPDPVAPQGRRLVFVDKPERTQTQILMGSLGTWPHDADHFPLVVATAVFGGTFTSRMMREIRSKRGWSYGTSARLSIERRRHAFTMSAAPGAADCAPCTKLEIELLEELVEEGITSRELSFIKNYLVRSHAFEVDTAPKRLGQALETELLALPADYHTRYLDHVKAVDLEASNAALKARLTPNDLFVVVVGTAGELLDKVKDAIPGLVDHKVVPFDAD